MRELSTLRINKPAKIKIGQINLHGVGDPSAVQCKTQTGEPVKITRVSGITYFYEFPAVQAGTPLVLSFYIEDSLNTAMISRGQSVDGDILSISISDMTALRVLRLIPDHKTYRIYSGSNFGKFLAILLAAGLQPSELATAFLEFGHRYFGPNWFNFVEPRRKWETVEKFCQRVLPNIASMKIKDLKGDIYLRATKANNGDVEVINQSRTPEMPLMTAIKASLASLYDTRPFVVKNPQKKTDVIWSNGGLGKNCPDSHIYIDYGRSKQMSFQTFVSHAAISEKSESAVKDFKQASANYQLDEIRRKDQAVHTIELMQDLIVGYQPTILEPLPTHNYMTRDIITMMLQNPKQLNG